MDEHKYTKDLHEICQFNNLTLNYSIQKIGGLPHIPEHECVLEILNPDNTLLLRKSVVDYGSKKNIKHKASKALLKSELGKTRLHPYILAKRIGKIEEPIEDNKYIQWGKHILTQYNVYLNDISCLDVFKTTYIAVDSEGFPKDGTIASLIQIADDKNVAIFDYHQYNKEINSFLMTKRLILCDAESDLRMLDITPVMYLDIQVEYKNTKDDASKSLKTMTGEMVGCEFKKPCGMFYEYNKWQFNNLDTYHQIYATTDAIATYKLFMYLKNNNNISM